jgi:hypothetical protein
MTDPAMLALLRAELTADPAGRGYAGHPADVQAEMVNSSFTTTVESGVPVLLDIATSAIEMIIVPPGEMFAIQTLADKVLSGQTPPTQEDRATGTAWSFLKMLDRWTTIDASKPDIWADCQTNMAALQAAGVLSAKSIAAITALVVVVPPPIVTERHARVLDIFLGVEGAPNAITADDVAGALA